MDKLGAAVSLLLMLACLCLTVYSLYRVGTAKPLHWALKVASVPASYLVYFLISTAIMASVNPLTEQALRGAVRAAFGCAIFHTLFMIWGDRVFSSSVRKRRPVSLLTLPDHGDLSVQDGATVAITIYDDVSAMRELNDRAARIQRSVKAVLPHLTVEVYGGPGARHDFDIQTSGGDGRFDKHIKGIIQSIVRDTR